MTVYAIGTLLAILLSYIATNFKNNRRYDVRIRQIAFKSFALFSSIPLMAIMAFRYQVGTDFLSYYRMFFHENSRMENGYAALNQLAKFITNTPQGVFIISAIIICGGFFVAIYRESVSPIYSILLFVLCKDYFIAMNGMRQYLATAIALFSIPLIKRHNWIKAAVVLLIAFSFHRSVVVFCILYMLSMLDITPLIGSAIIVGTFIMSQTIRNIVFPLLSRYGFYVNYFMSGSGFNNATGAFLNRRLTVVFFCFFLLMCFEYKSVRKESDLRLLYSAVLCTMILLSLSEVMPTNFSRLTWHLNSFVVLYTPLAVQKFPNKKMRPWLGAAILCAYAFVSIPEILVGQHGVLPYKTIWNH